MRRRRPNAPGKKEFSAVAVLEISAWDHYSKRSDRPLLKPNINNIDDNTEGHGDNIKDRRATNKVTLELVAEA